MKCIRDGIVRYSKWVVAAFIIAAALGAVLQFWVETNYNVIDYLPRDAQSTRALSIMEREFIRGVPNTRVMLNDVTIPEVLEYKRQLATIDGVDDVLWLDDVMDIKVPLEMADPSTVEKYYKDSKALISLTVRDGEEVRIVREIYAIIGDGHALSGAAADRATLQTMTGNETQNATSFLIPLIFIILFLSTTSWVEPFLFLGAIGVSVLINMGTNVFLGEVSFVTRAVSPILQLAVSLDYAIFLLHSFEYYRKQTPHVEEAMGLAMSRAASTIAASAATTLFGFMALMFMRFEIGADLGINLVKGIILSFISVMVFLPALILCLYKLIDRTRHRKLMPSFRGLGPYVYSARLPVLVVVILLLVPSFLAQGRINFTYGDSGLGQATRSGNDTRAVNKEFGRSTAIVLLVPSGDPAREGLLTEELKRLGAVNEVISYPSQVGTTIPSEFLDSSIVSTFISENYARLVVYVDTASEGDRAFEVVQEVQALSHKHYGERAVSAGPSVNLYDMKNVVTRDNRVVNRLAIAAILIVLLITFKSLALPLILLVTIEAAIWINVAVPYFVGSTLSYVGFLIIQAVQLGATVDYAILLCNHYMENRKSLSRAAALQKTLEETCGSILVSAAILAFAGFVLWMTSTNPLVSELGLLLGRGTALSMLMVLVFLPSALTMFDRVIEITTHRAHFFGER